MINLILISLSNTYNKEPIRMKKMIIALVVVICVQLIITLCYYEKTLVDKFDFETV